jgi:hypothetical protein
MKPIAHEMTDHILLIEDEAVARFYDLIGFGAEYRAADTSNETRRILREFKANGWNISRIDRSDHVFRMTLSRYGAIYAWQDIMVSVNIGAMGGV